LPRIDDAAPPKEPKPKPVAVTPSTKPPPRPTVKEAQQAQTREKAQESLAHIKRGVEVAVGYGRQQTADAINMALSDRAKQLSPKLLARNPSLAAELLLGPTKTAHLGRVSSAAYDGWQSQMATVRAHEAPEFAPAPFVPDPVLLEFAQKANTIEDEHQRQLYLFALEKHKNDPDSAPFLLAAARDGKLTPDIVGIPHGSDLQELAAGLGTVISLPIAAPAHLISSATDVGQKGLGKVEAAGIPGISGYAGTLSKNIESAQKFVGTNLKTLGTATQFATRNLEVVPILGEAVQHPEYFTSWSEAEQGGHSPISQFIARSVLDTDVDDPKYQGLFDVTDLSADLVTQTAAFSVLSAVKTARTLPDYAGGKLSGGDFVTTRLGKKLTGQLTDDLVKYGERPVGPPAAFEFVPKQLSGDVRATIADVAPAGDYAYRLVDKSSLPRLADTGVEPVAPTRLGTWEDGTTQARAYWGESGVDTVQLAPEVSNAGTLIRVRTGDAGTLVSGTFKGEMYSTGGARPGAIEYLAPDKTWHPLTDFQAAGPATTRAALLDRYKSMNPSLADRLTNLGPNPTRAEVGRALADHIDTVPSKAIEAVTRELDAVKSRLREYDGKATLTAEEAAEFTALKVEKASLEAKLEAIQNFEPVWRFPKKSRMQAIMRGLPDGPLGRMLHALFGEEKGFTPAKWANDLSPKELNFLDPSARTKPSNWASHNVDVIRKQMNVAGVDKVTQRATIEDMLRIREGDAAATFNWGRQYEDALRKGLTKDGTRTLSLEADAALNIWTDRSLEERMQAPIEVTGILPDGSTITSLRNVLEAPDGTPLPTDLNEFAGSFKLPDMQLLEDLSSNMRYLDRQFESTPVLGKLYGVGRLPVDIARFVALTIPRLILRPLVLVPRFLLGPASPAGIKVFADESVRMFETGLSPWQRTSVTLKRLSRETGEDYASLMDTLPPEGVEALGLFASETAAGLDSVVMKMRTDIDPIARAADWDLIGMSRFETLTKLHEGPIARQVALRGAEDALAYLEAHPLSLEGRTWVTVKESAARAGVDPLTVLKTKEVQIEQAAGGNPAWREAIGTGKLRGDERVPTGYTMEKNLQLDEVRVAKEELARVQDPLLRNEINLRIEEAERRVEWLEAHDPAGNVLDISNGEAVIDRLLNDSKTGRYTMPNEVIVRKPVTIADEAAKSYLGRQNVPPGTERLYGWMERRRAQLTRINRQLYKGMKLQSKGELYFARGRTHAQVYAITLRDLLAKGYGLEEAKVVASYRAAGIAKDLHYDISARSTMDRKLKDTFWFAPVWREQMLTYLYKIPSRAYWPAGLFLEYAQAHTLIQGLKALGVLDEVPVYNVKTGKNESELTFRIPWFSDFVGKVLGNSDAGGMKVGGFNPITPGTSGFLPTYSPGVETILRMTAKVAPKEIKGFLELASRFTEFDSNLDEGPSFIPTPIIRLAELMGINVPWDQLSPKEWKEATNRAGIQSHRWAMSELAKEGILPPGRDASPEEVRRYANLLDERAGKYEQGLGLIHAIGGILLPGSLVTGTADQPTGYTKAGAAYLKWRYETGPLAGPDSIPFGDDAYYDALNEYMKAHPAAWPYSVSKHPGKYDPNYVPYGSPTYADTTLDTELWVERAIERVAYWKDDEPSTSGTPVGEEEAPAVPFAQLSPRRQQVAAVLAATVPASEMTSDQADALGLPSFDGRDKLIRKLGETSDVVDKFIDNHPHLSDADTQKLYDLRDATQAKLAAQYDEDGLAVLKSLTATPAQRLKQANYWHGPAATVVMAQVETIQRTEANDSSYSITQGKIDLYRKLELLRRTDDRFDRDIRRAELALHVKDRTKGVVAVFEYLFFGNESNYFGYQDDIVKALNATS